MFDSTNLYYDPSDPNQPYDPSLPPGGGGSGSGGPPSPVPPSPDKTLTELQIDENATLALAYGQHVVAGNLVEYEHTSGPPPSCKFIVALGNGPWNAISRAWYAGESISASASSTTPGYKFHPGTLSTGTGDAVQGSPMFFPSSATYSRTAYAEVLLSTDQSVEERPDKFRAVCECLKVADYDSVGNLVDAGSYSTNPARIAADLLNRAGLLSRVDWASWTTWKNYCDVLITWGGSTIKRFESNLVLTQSMSILNALTIVCQSSCTYWQDNGQSIEFLPVLSSSNVVLETHAFTESNCRSVSLYVADQRSLPTGYKATFRDVDTEYLEEVSVEYFDADLEEYTSGQNRVEIQLPPMKRSQAERICYWRTQLDGVCNAGIELIAFGDAYALLPGDLITIAHELLLPSNAVESSLFGSHVFGSTRFWERSSPIYRAMVTETEELEEGPQLKRIRAKILMTTPYSDTAHSVPVP